MINKYRHFNFPVIKFVCSDIIKLQIKINNNLMTQNKKPLKSKKLHNFKDHGDIKQNIVQNFTSVNFKQQEIKSDIDIEEKDTEISSININYPKNEDETKEIIELLQQKSPTTIKSCIGCYGCGNCYRFDLE